MATEEQTQFNNSTPIGISLNVRVAQKLPITNRLVSKLGFWLHKVGTPPGNVTFVIYAQDDDEVLASKVLGTADSLTTSPAYYEVTFDSPVSINEAVYIAAVDTEVNGTNYVRVNLQLNPSVKAGENLATHNGTVWSTSGITEYDCAYIYTYTSIPVAVGYSQGIIIT